MNRANRGRRIKNDVSQKLFFAVIFAFHLIFAVSLLCRSGTFSTNKFLLNIIFSELAVFTDVVVNFAEKAQSIILRSSTI